MAHDPTKVLLGTTLSSDRPGATTYQSDPAIFPAGTACRLGSDGLLTKTKGANQWVGISLGRSHSDTNKTSVLRAGSAVPILLAAAFTPVIGALVFISDTTGLAGADDTGLTVSNAIYVSGIKDGIAEDGTTVPVAYVDMIGGL